MQEQKFDNYLTKNESLCIVGYNNIIIFIKKLD